MCACVLSFKSVYVCYVMYAYAYNIIVVVYTSTYMTIIEFSLSLVSLLILRFI